MTTRSNPAARAAIYALLGCCFTLSGCPRDSASLGAESGDPDAGTTTPRAGSSAPRAGTGGSTTGSGAAGSRAGSGGAPPSDRPQPPASDAGVPPTDPMRPPATDAGTPTDPPTTDAGTATGVACGSRGLRECPAGQYCNFPPRAQCGDTDVPGVCMVIPSPVCTREYVPVCGCDGMTYGNRCVAASNGVSIRSAGECGGGTAGSGGGGDVCGGIAGFACPRGEYCNYPRDALCGAADATGVCEVMPQACTLEYNPVCGCDDHTYGNACAAAAAGVSVQSDGEC